MATAKTRSYAFHVRLEPCCAPERTIHIQKSSSLSVAISGDFETPLRRTIFYNNRDVAGRNPAPRTATLMDDDHSRKFDFLLPDFQRHISLLSPSGELGASAVHGILSLSSQRPWSKRSSAFEAFLVLGFVRQRCSARLMPKDDPAVSRAAPCKVD